MRYISHGLTANFKINSLGSLLSNVGRAVETIHTELSEKYWDTFLLIFVFFWLSVPCALCCSLIVHHHMFLFFCNYRRFKPPGTRSSTSGKMLWSPTTKRSTWTKMILSLFWVAWDVWRHLANGTYMHIQTNTIWTLPVSYVSGICDRWWSYVTWLLCF